MEQHVFNIAIDYSSWV